MSAPLITQLRDIVPIRPLTRHEALMIAERQALKMLLISEVNEAPVATQLVTELPRIEVRRVSPFPTSGATQWSGGRWLVVLNGAEPVTRQRFSLAHEFKHILDHPFVDSLYGAVDAHDRQRWIEQVCDYFAGCLLMPRPWVKRAWASEQRLELLARQFQVSHAAMSTRLAQIGLTKPMHRCGHVSDQDLRRLPHYPLDSYPRYERAATVAPAVGLSQLAASARGAA